MICCDYRNSGYMTWDSDNCSGGGTGDCATATVLNGCNYTMTVAYGDCYQPEIDEEIESQRALFMSIIRWLEYRFGMVFSLSRYWPELLYYKTESVRLLMKILFDKTPERYYSGFV